MENENTNTAPGAPDPAGAASEKEAAANSIPVASPSFLGEMRTDFWDDFLNS